MKFPFTKEETNWEGFTGCSELRLFTWETEPGCAHIMPALLDCSDFQLQRQLQVALVHTLIWISGCRPAFSWPTHWHMFSLKYKSALSGGNGSRIHCLLSSWVGPCVVLQPGSYSSLPVTLGPHGTKPPGVLLAVNKYLRVCHMLSSLVDIGLTRAFWKVIQMGEVVALGKDRGSGMEGSETFIDIEEIESMGLGEEEKQFGCLPGSGLCS